MRLRLIISLVMFVVSSTLVRAEAPRYRWQPNSRFVYQVDITADSPLQTDTMTGRRDQVPPTVQRRMDEDGSRSH